MIIDTHTNDEWKHKRFHVGLKHKKCILNEFKRCKHAKENRKENWQNSQSNPLNIFLAHFIPFLRLLTYPENGRWVNFNVQLCS